MLCRLFQRLEQTSSLRRYSTHPRSSIQTVAVIGAGQMGGGIAQVLSQKAQKSVILVDVSAKMTSKSMELMDHMLRMNVKKGKVTEEERLGTLSRITTSNSMEQLKSADFVIEAVSEDPTLKFEIFKDLSAILPDEVILASNTSSISITKISAQTNRPDKVIGMHFMNPVPVMSLVEVISGMQTSAETLSTTLLLARQMGKTIAQSKDFPGFIANRLLMPYINEAIFALSEGLGTKEDIDSTMKLGCNMPMGPLALADFIGLDTCLAIMQIIHTELGDSKYRPSPLLTKYVEAGWLGKKTGQGFYKYE